MELQLRNIGMIKEANVKIDGLTVIAGENDTGKSTVGKALYLTMDTIFYNGQDFNPSEDWKKDALKISFLRIYKELFDEPFPENASIIFSLCSTKNWNFSQNKNGLQTEGLLKERKHEEVIFIESPLVWNFTDFFRDIALIESQYKIELDYPYLMKDLNFKFHIKSATNGVDIKDKVVSLMGGEFKKDESDHYYFDKKGERVELVNTATGIKQFAIFQVLSQNGWLNKDTILILDEPEVHLHPKWQLEMAKIIVELVESGTKVLVNSHSPYMIEALRQFSSMMGLENKTNFYIADSGNIKQIDEDNSRTLADIYELLSEPYDFFEEMDAKRLENFLDG